MTRTGSSHLRTNNGVLQTFSVDGKNQVTNSGIFVNYQYDTNGNLSFNQTGSHSSQ